MVTRRRGARGLTSGMRAGWLVAAGLAAAVGVTGVRVAGGGQRAPVALRPAPAPPAAEAPPAGPVTAPDTADRAAAPTAPPSPAAAFPPAPPPPAATPPRPAPRPAVAPAAAPLGVQPPGLTETVPAGSALSPLVTFTVTVTGPGAVTIGAVTTTVPAFRIVRDGCSGVRLAPGGSCGVTVQLSAAAPGHQAGSLLVPVAGARPASARLEGTVR